PMLTVSSSRSSVSVSVSAIRLSRDREVHWFAGERLGALQGITLPVVGQHDALQIRMPLELDAEQIKHFAFVPVGCWNHGGQTRRRAVSSRLYAYPFTPLHRIEQVHQLEATLPAEVVNRRQVYEARVAQLASNPIQRRHQLRQVDCDAGD